MEQRFDQRRNERRDKQTQFSLFNGVMCFLLGFGLGTILFGVASLLLRFLTSDVWSELKYIVGGLLITIIVCVIIAIKSYRES